MAIHCFSIIYSPNASMDNYLDSWLNSWTAWTEEETDNPQPLTFRSTDPSSDKEVKAAGFQQNRFELDDTTKTLERDARYIVSNLVGANGYLAAYCDWWIVKWHHCVHDDDTRTVERTRELPDGSTQTYEEEVKGCGDWKVLDSSTNYANFDDVPEEVN